MMVEGSVACVESVTTKKEGVGICLLLFLVEMTGFEPAASSSRTKRATKLRYISILCCVFESDSNLRLPTKNIVVSLRCSLVILLIFGFLRLAVSSAGRARLRHLVPHSARKDIRVGAHECAHTDIPPTHYNMHPMVCQCFFGAKAAFSIDKRAVVAVYWWVIMEQYLLCQRSDAK